MAKKYFILLNLANLSPAKIKNIIAALDDPCQLLTVKESSLSRIPGITEFDARKIIKLRDRELEEELELIEKEKISCFDMFDKDYPSILKEIENPPLVLYLKGNSSMLSKFLFAIVGTRLPTAYGLKMAEEFSYKLSLLDICIVSGLAKGIDTAAHQAAIRKGNSVAVLGSGILNIYPRQNLRLSQEIAAAGAVISEFGLTWPPSRENFPRRNRIISGLSKGVLVIEAAQRSGALITARLACEQNREVFGVPGCIDSSLSKGANSLIKDGARLVDSIEDILLELNIQLDTNTEELFSQDCAKSPVPK